MIVALRQSTAKARKLKRDRWWARKHGPGSKAPEEAGAEGEEEGGEEEGGEEQQQEQDEASRGVKRARDGDEESELGVGDDGAKRGRQLEE